MHDRVEHRLHTLVLERSPAEDGDEFPFDRRATQGGAQLILADFLALKVLERQLFIGLGHQLDHRLTMLARLIRHRRRNHGRLGLGTQVIGEDDALVGDQIDMSLVLALAANGDLDRHRLRRSGGR